MHRAFRLALLALAVTAAPACAQDGPRHPVVAVGAPELRAERITAGVDTLHVMLTVDGTRGKVGHMVLSTSLDGDSIRRSEVVVLGSRQVSAETFSVSRRGLAPGAQRQEVGPEATALAFRGAEVTGRIAAGGRPRDVRVLLPQAAFYGNQVDLLLRALPLAEGYAASLPVFDDDRDALGWLHLRVAGTESVTLHGGTVAPAWRVVVDDTGREQTYWVAVGSQALLRHASRTADGDTLLLVR